MNNNKGKSFMTKEVTIKPVMKTHFTIDAILSLLPLIEPYYPDVKKWLVSKFTSDSINRGERIIIGVYVDLRLVGCMLLKDDNEESKICTLIVKPEYRGLGIGSLLMEEAITLLEDDKPKLSFPEEAYDVWSKLLAKYNINDLVTVYESMRPNKIEFYHG